MILTRNDTEPAIESSAAAKVFAMPELLEAILIEVGESEMKSLFVLQRVDTTFQDTIERTRTLRRVMFKQGTNKESDTEPTLNPLLFNKSANRVLYPLLFREWVPHESWPMEFGGNECEVSFLDFIHATDVSQETKPRAANASWRTLKLCHSITARWIDCEISEQSVHKFFSFETDAHTTLGELADNLLKRCQDKFWSLDD